MVRRKVAALSLLCFMSIGATAWAPASAEHQLANGLEFEAGLGAESTSEVRADLCGPVEKLDLDNVYDHSYGDYNCAGSAFDC